MKNAFLVIAIFVTVLFVSANVCRMIKGLPIPAANNIYMAIGITALVTHFLGIW